MPAWYIFRDVRAGRRAVEWLVDNSLVDDETGERFMTEHADPTFLEPAPAPRDFPDDERTHLPPSTQVDRHG